LPKEEQETRTLWVDDIDGSVHRLYSGFPNSVHVMDAQGLVVCRCDWANTQKIEEVLSNLEQVDDQDLVQPRPPTPRVVLRVFHRAGWSSAFEFILGLPRLIIAHRKAVAVRTSRSESGPTRTRSEKQDYQSTELPNSRAPPARYPRPCLLQPPTEILHGTVQPFRVHGGFSLYFQGSTF